MTTAQTENAVYYVHNLSLHNNFDDVTVHP
jgi:hypothetical protein